MEGVPASSKMHFRPGSMAIPMLTTLLLRLQDRDRLDLDDKLSRWYPTYPNADRVTLRMLASSTSGYPDYIQGNLPFQAASTRTSFDTGMTGAAPLRVRAAVSVRARRVLPLCAHQLRHPRQGGAEDHRAVGGEPRRRRFLRPLGLRDTRISKRPGIPAPTLHAYKGERGVYEDSTTWSPSWGIGQGMVMTSTLRDMTKMIRAIGARRLSRGQPGASSTPRTPKACQARPRSTSGSASRGATGGSTPSSSRCT